MMTNEKQDVIALEDYAANLEIERDQLRAQIAAMKTAMGVCTRSADGKHSWMMFPVDTHGHIVMTAGMAADQGSYAAGGFCQHCMVPKSPYHDDIQGAGKDA